LVKVCFLSLNSYPIIAKAKTVKYAGGEVEYVSLARELSKLGYYVHFTTYKERGYESPEVENINGIKIIKTYPRYQVKSLNTFLKTKIIFKALERSDADIYFGYGSLAILPIFSLFYNKKFVYRISSDIVALGGTYSSPKDHLLRYYFRSLVNHVEIKRAHAVIAQTERQKKLLREKLGVDSIVIKNGFPVPEPFNFMKEKTFPPVVLWVANLSYVKQPQVFLKLAKSIPEVTFEMIGGKAEKEPELYDLIKRESKKISNFKYRGFVPFSEINGYFKRASLLVNTSIYEGLPMSFIQAWLNYTTTVSLNVDPDGIIEEEGIGFCSKSFDHLVQDVYTLIMDENLRKKMCQRARRYAEREFDVKIIARKYANVFKKLFET
jgi:glycosyltransferase involved in cell wall biosynthesis